MSRPLLTLVSALIVVVTCLVDYVTLPTYTLLTLKTLEGAGSGGPSLLFRASNSDIVRHYADHAPFPHASVFSNDVFQLGLIDR